MKKLFLLAAVASMMMTACNSDKTEVRLQGVRLCTATSGIFPLCLGRKTELLASELAERLDKPQRRLRRLQ